ncbi:hypothetical protein ACFYM0_20705 [Streptomyces sp. NPDC006487]|uniref:hypothetical protein n=1 Tax=Streptomyces sp. NPDC006487 TaxID=3364748 RepID=UPI003697C0B9
MSATGAAGVPRPSAVSMGALLAAGAAASAVSTPPARERSVPDPDPAGEGTEDGEQAAPESEAA